MNLQLACKLLTSSVIAASINANDDNMQHQRKLSSLKDDVGSGCANHVDFHSRFLTTAGEKCASCTLCPQNYSNQIFIPKAKDICIECTDEKDSCNAFELVTVFDEEWSMKVVTLKATDMDASHNPESVKFLGSNDGNDWDELLTAKLHFDESNDTIQFLFDNEKAYTNYAMQLSGLKTKTYVGKYGIIESYTKACTAHLYQEITGVSIPYYTTATPTASPTNFGHQFNNNEELKTAVDLYLTNEKSASSQYGVINDWDVSRITDMSGMFQNAKVFNSNISDWNTSSVTNMENMFNGARAFNFNISDWDISKVTAMYQMFMNAEAFDQVLCWDVSKASTVRMFNGYGSLSPHYPKC